MVVPERAAPRALVLVAVVVLLRLPMLGAPARPDEAGYLLVARHLSRGGPFLYGRLFVDRPPLLLAVFRAADALGGLPALRLLGVVAAVVLVLACATAGQVVAGRRGWWAAGVVAAALQATRLLGAPEVDGELLGTPLVALAAAVGLAALRTPERRRGLIGTALAGALAGTALLVKQNLGDAGVLLGVVVLGGVVQRRVRPRRGLLLLCALGAGAAVPLLLAAGWAAHRGAGVGVAWHDLVSFRSASLQVLDARPSPARTRRALELGLAALASGAAPLAALALVLPRRGPVPAGLALTRAPLAAMLLAGTAGAVLGGSWWQHYLLELVPAVALAAAVVASRVPVRVAAVLLLAVVGSAVVAAVPARAGPCGQDRGAQRVSRWLAHHAGPGDSGVAVYGGADVLLGSGLRLDYPYLWSLPVRTLDPRLALLTAQVSGPRRTDWVVLTTPVEAWGLDSRGRLTGALAIGYRTATTICGRTVLHRTT